MAEYWIVDLDARLFERWLPNDDGPQIVTDALVWNPVGALGPFRLDVARYFAEVFEDLEK